MVFSIAFQVKISMINAKVDTTSKTFQMRKVELQLVNFPGEGYSKSSKSGLAFNEIRQRLSNQQGGNNNRDIKKKGRTPGAICQVVDNILFSALHNHIGFRMRLQLAR